MEKQPILAVFAHIKEEHMKEIQTLATHYQVVDARKAWPTDVPPENIEISFGWQADICQNSLKNGQLKWLQTISAGVNSYPLTELKEKNVYVTNASGIHAVPITESILGMLLSYNRGIISSVLNQKESHWQQPTSYSELFQKKVLVVGTGKIGQRFAEVANSLGMNVAGCNRSGHPVVGFAKTYPQSALKEAVETADIVVNILPETPDTHHLFDKEVFHHMTDGVCFINVGRGATVKTEDLIEALKNGKIAFAGLDVFEDEPLSAASPLWKMSNVLITPHISGLVENFRNRLFVIFQNNLTYYLANHKPIENLVDLEKGY